METRKELTKRYSFPSVNVTEIVRSPVRQDVEWRNTIGVAAPFSKGPRLARISGNRKELIALFGEDQSLGSLFVQQAMLQGASDFVISRVVPESQSANGAICITPLENKEYIEPVVNEYGERTIGLKFKSTYISDFQPSPGAFLGVQTVNSNSNYKFNLTTNSDSSPTISVRGVGYFDLNGIELVDITALTNQNILKETRAFKVLDLAASSGVFKIKFDGDAHPELTQLIQSIKPGLALKADTGVTITSANSQLEILSYAIPQEDGSFEVLVKGVISTVTGTEQKLVVEPKTVTPTINSYVIVGVKYRGQGALDGSVVYTNDEYISYLIAPHNSRSGIPLPINYYTSIGSQITSVATGITVAFGAAGVTAQARTSYKLRGTITFFNTEVAIGEVNTNNGDSSDAFAPGTSILDIYEQLQDVILGNEVFNSIYSDVEINTSTLPYTLSFKLKTRGSIGNKIKYTLTLNKTADTALDLLIDGKVVPEVGTAVLTDTQNMVGGSDGLKAADVTFYDVRGNALLYVQAISPGSASNNIALNIKPIKNGEFILEAYEATTTFSSTTLPAESYYLTNKSANPENGLYTETATSNLIRAYFIPLITANSELSPEVYNQLPLRLAPPDLTITTPDNLTDVTHPSHRGEAYLQNIKLSGGKEPTNYPRDNTSFSEDDYILAIERLKEEDVCFIAAPGIVAGDLNYANAVDALIKQAEQSTPYEGLRIAIVATPPRMSASRARVITSNINSDRVVLLAGYSRVAGFSGNANRLASSEGFYAGYLVNIPPHVSPAAQYNSGLNGVLSLDMNYTLDELDVLTKFNIEVLHLDPVTKVYKFLNGRTTSEQLAERWVSIRRHADHLIMSLFRSLQWAKAMPNDETLRTLVASSCDAFLKYEKSRGHITDYSPTISDESVNTAEDILTGNLNILLRYIPKVPADYINLTVIRDFSARFSVNVN